MPMLESAMEELLIRQLACDVSQWTYRPDIRTEDDLWQNLREKLNAANIDRLQGVLLTDAEMAALAEIDHNCRLIKGQVFLWPGAEDWKEIWED